MCPAPRARKGASRPASQAGETHGDAKVELSPERRRGGEPVWGVGVRKVFSVAQETKTRLTG